MISASSVQFRTVSDWQTCSNVIRCYSNRS